MDMTSTSVRPVSGLSVPPSQNTAPVHEFRCLYTHDLRKKSKKWQDGRVKYHTFNKRVMLYDDTLNLIGDTHWKDGGDLQVGDAVTLDAGVLIDVEDLLVTTQTDLAPLWGKDKNKQHQHDKMHTAKATNNARVAAPPRATHELNTMPPKQGHQSLSALLSKTQGAYGKALLPAQSPFELRKVNKENEWESERQTKRRKPNSPKDDPPSWARTAEGGERSVINAAKIASNAYAERGIQRANLLRESINMTSDTEVQLSDVTLPPSPKAGRKGVARSPAAISVVKTTVPRVSSAKPTLPPVSTKIRRRHGESLPDGQDREDNSAASITLQKEPSASTVTTKTLRIGKSQARPMLMCQKKTSTSVTSASVASIAHKRRSNLYIALSDMEDESSLFTAKRTTKKTAHVPARPIEATGVDFTLGSSSTAAAFDTGQSSSPRLTAVRRGEAPVLNAVPDSAQTNLFDNDKNSGPEIEAPRSQKQHAQQELKHSSRYKKSVTKLSKQENRLPSRTTSKKVEESSTKRAAPRSKKKPLRSIIDKANEAAEEIAEGIGSRAMEEKAKALANAPQKEQGAWSVEALDLFDWRPPDWDERVKKRAIPT